MPVSRRLVERGLPTRRLLGVIGMVGVLWLAACAEDPAATIEAPRVATPVPRGVAEAGEPVAELDTAGRLSPRSLLQASDAAMVRQTGTVLVSTISRPGAVHSSEEMIEDMHPSTTTARADGGYAIGRRDIPEAITRSDDVRVLRVGEVDGVEAWVIWYTFRYLTFEGVINLWRTEWIEMDSLRLLRQFEQDDDGFNPFESIDRRFRHDR